MGAVNTERALLHRLAIILEMIKFEHTLFALPFAASGALLAAGGIPPLRVCLGILFAMVGARSAAMAFNRLVDREWDARNPRTASRALPAGLLGVGFVRFFVIACSAVFVAASASLNPLAFALSPIALAVILGYSYAKRFTCWSHAWLGAALAIAPMGAWVAVRGTLDLLPLWLCAAVVAWLVGLDILYALQDEQFDREVGLHSIPARYGSERALIIARASHASMVGCLLGLGWFGRMGLAFFAGVAIVCLLLIWEHTRVRPGDLRRINQAFFHANVAVSFLVLGSLALDLGTGWGTR